MSDITAQIVGAAEGIAAFAEEWERLFEAAASEPTTSLEWTRALVHNYVRPDDRAFVVRLERGGRAVGFVPLLARPFRVLRQRCIRLTPMSEVFNTHSDLLLLEGGTHAIDALLDALRRLDVRWDGFRMSRLLQENPIGPQLNERARAGGWICRTRQRRPAYHLPLPATFDEYFAARSAKFRNHARRMEKKLRAAGAVRVIEISDRAAFEASYDALLQVERASWKASRGISIHGVSHRTAFYREWGPAAAAAGRLHVQLLMLDGEPIAHNIGYVTGGCYYYLKTSYAAAHRPLSPATFLRLRLIEGLIAQGITRLDMPGNPYDWEGQWTDMMRPQITVSIYPRTVRGRVLAWLDRRFTRAQEYVRRDRRYSRPDERPRRAPSAPTFARASTPDA
ncbi:MAG: GNAT family N-acetyltransferase [Vicinamibacterales bacterium]